MKSLPLHVPSEIYQTGKDARNSFPCLPKLTIEIPLQKLQFLALIFLRSEELLVHTFESLCVAVKM